MKQNIKVGILALSMSAFISLWNGITISSADVDLEQQFISITKGYNSEDIIVENGISLRFGETVDLSKCSDLNISSEGIVEIDENGIVTPIGEGSVYLSYTVNDKIHVIEVYVPSTTSKFLKNKTIRSIGRDYYKVFLDPGHGGHDNGASGNGYLEDELNLKISKLVQEKLVQKGIEVRMSRTTDTFLSLKERATLANNYDADIFVSIHQNSADATSANGIETYYHTNKSAHKNLSNEIQTNSIKQTNARNRGVKSADFAVLRESTMPSALFEAGFISNKDESAKLGSSSYQDKIATGIADGIQNYLKNNIKLDVESSNRPEEMPIINTGTVNTDDLNIRTGPSASYSIIGKLQTGDKVEIVEKVSDWYKIKLNQGYGYVHGRYVDIDENEAVVDNLGWKKEDGVWYYINSDGTKATGWIKVDGKWYYLYSSGAMATGWVKVDGKWYYLYSSGAMATGWVKVDGKWYYLYSSGAMATGWVKVDGKWYYLYSSGAMATGWVKVDGKWYYLYSSGAMATNTVIDGWKIDGSGVATKIR